MPNWFNSLRRKFARSKEFGEIQRQIAFSEGVKEIRDNPEKLKEFHETVKYVRTDGTSVEPSTPMTEDERLRLLLGEPDES